MTPPEEPDAHEDLDEHFTLRNTLLAVPVAGLADTDEAAFAELARLDAEGADLVVRLADEVVHGLGAPPISELADHYRRRATIWVHLAQRHPDLTRESALAIEAWRAMERRAEAQAIQTARQS